MAPAVIDPSAYSEDILEFIRCLNRAEVRYLIVGGEAVIFHGYPRFTEDIDFYYASDEEALERLIAALNDFWDGDIPVIQSKDDLRSPGYVIQFGRKPNRIDLLNQIDGVDFEQAWENRVKARIGEDDPIQVYFLGKVELIKNKIASGRHKDLDDSSYLIESDENQA